MSPEQLKKLQQLNQLFAQGSVGPKQVKQLSALLAEINQLANWPEENIKQTLPSH